MALTPRLELRQSQSLVMTPQLQQAIKMLQLSNLELSEYVEQELEKNPMLERDEDDHRDQDDGPAESADSPNSGDEADTESLASIQSDAAPPPQSKPERRHVRSRTLPSARGPPPACGWR